MKVIGLDGGIASGKSTVSNILNSMEFPIIDGDKIAREIVEPGSRVLSDIENEFGHEIINNDGTLNRKKLGEIVFSSKDALMRLNRLTHPEIKNIISERILNYAAEGLAACVVDAAILIEADFLDLVDFVVLVYIEPAIQIKRLIERDGMTEEAALKRISSQMSFDEKRKFADYVIDNSRDIEYTRKQINNIIKEIL